MLVGITIMPRTPLVVTSSSAWPEILTALVTEWLRERTRCRKLEITVTC